MTTTARQPRVLRCPRCNFLTNQLRHMQQCVPTRYWPPELRDRKARAMGILPEVATCCDRPIAEHPYFQDGRWHFATVEQRQPGFTGVKPSSLYEYRQQHPEANPLVGENQTRLERRKNLMGDEVDMEVVVSLAEARGYSDCPRCGRPMLIANAHLDCRPRALTGPGWYDRVPAVEPLTPAETGGTPADDPELADFLDPGAALRAQLAAEQAAERAARSEFEALDAMTPDEAAQQFTLEVPQPETMMERLLAAETTALQEAPSAWGCASCGRVLKTRAALISHEKSHQREA